MNTDQAAADRERIAGEMKSRGAPACLEMDTTLDAAVRAFEVLCKPKGWRLGKCPVQGWYAITASVEGDADTFDVTEPTNHAADVCRLVCEVLDREQEAPR